MGIIVSGKLPLIILVPVEVCSFSPQSEVDRIYWIHHICTPVDSMGFVNLI